MATDSSSEPKQGCPSFFKVVRNPSAPHLSLPIAFVNMYLNKIPKNPTLKTATREHSWRLKIKKIGEDYCFTHGWEKLVQEAQLRIKDILVFWLIDPYTFQVSFFDEHGCEKDLPFNNSSYGDEDDGDHDDVGPDEDVYFQKVISEKNHKCYMVMPKIFVDAAGLAGKSSVKIRDKEGKEWEIGLRTETYSNTRVYLAKGWPFFRQHHDLFDGDMCLFRYIKKENVLILAELIKSKRPTKRQTPDVGGFKRKIRRPPVDGGGDGDGGVKVKVEDESDPEVEVVKRKREKPPVGGVEVKIEDESSPEVAVAKNQNGAPPLGKPCGSGGGDVIGVKVKIEDESYPEEGEVVKRDKGGPPVVKPCGGGGGGGGGEVRTEPETERVVRHKQVIYF